MVPTGTVSCPFWNGGGFVLPCAANLCRPVEQLSGTDTQNQLLLGLGPLDLAWIFLACPWDLRSDLSVRERFVSELPCGNACVSAWILWVFSPNCLTSTSGERGPSQKSAVNAVIQSHGHCRRWQLLLAAVEWLEHPLKKKTWSLLLEVAPAHISCLAHL